MKIFLKQKVEPASSVQDLDGIVVVVLGDPLDLLTIRRGHRDTLKTFRQLRIRIEQRLLQLIQSPPETDVGEIRTQKTTLASDHVTICTGTLSVKDHPSGLCISHHITFNRRCVETAHKTGQLPDLSVRQTERRHFGSGDACLDQLKQLLHTETAHLLHLPPQQKAGTAPSLSPGPVTAATKLAK